MHFIQKRLDIVVKYTNNPSNSAYCTQIYQALEVSFQVLKP